MDKDNKTVEVAVEIKHETNAAILVTDGTRDAWIPKSQIILDDEFAGQSAIYQKGQTMTITLPEWLAKDKELI